VLRLPGNALRFYAITLTALGCLLVYGGLRLGSLFIFDRERRASRVAHIRGRLLRWSMGFLGASFIKLGQVMSTRPDLLPPEMIEELRKLQDRLPAFGFRRARRIIERDLNGPLEDHFAEFDEKAVAAASVAQVHRARLTDGTEVAVKVLRPAVRRKVERDAAIVVGFAKFISFVRRKYRATDLVGHAQHFVDGIVAQTDLRSEVDNYERFRANFEEVPEIIFPEVYPELSGEHVLTMQYMRGQKIDALGPGPHPELAEKTRLVFFKMCFQDGFVHSDLHPGNMLVTEEGNVVVFDVGLVKRLSDDLLLQLVDFSRCVAMGTTEDLTNHLRRFHAYLDDVDWEAVGTDTQALIDRFRGQSVADLEMGEFINEIFELARRHRVRPIPEMTLVLVGVITAEGISKILDPSVNNFDEMATYLVPIVQRLGLNQPLAPS
jgi:ubiquinone biosynthesis protein